MIPQVPDTTYAVVSAFAWAASTIVVNRGLTRMRRSQNRYDVTLGLAASLVTGTLLLSVFVFPRFDPALVSTYLVLSGLFTFPIGTGLYYYTSEMYMQKAEIAAQFVKVKPIFSVVFAVYLGERLSRLTGIGLGFILVGLLLLLFATLRGEFSRLAAVIGMATALVWAIGEAFMKLGVAATSSLMATYVALLTGTVVYLAVTIPAMYGSVSPRRAVRQGWLLPFAGHGVLSFGVAYTSFFTSIKTIGLAQTALVTAFWPILAIGLNYVWNRLRGEDTATEIEFKYLLPASATMVVGSLLAAL